MKYGINVLGKNAERRICKVPPPTARLKMAAVLWVFFEVTVKRLSGCHGLWNQRTWYEAGAINV